MPAEATGVWCNTCGRPLDARPTDPVESRMPCPKCGSTGWLVKLEAHDEATIHEDLALKKRTPGFRSGGRSRPTQELWSGEVKSEGDVWRRRHRVVDRENNRYSEHVSNPDGTVVHDMGEPLDQHLGHGSDNRST